MARWAGDLSPGWSGFPGIVTAMGYTGSARLVY